MKLVVGMAVMDVVEHGQLHLQDAIGDSGAPKPARAAVIAQIAAAVTVQYH
jgi:hypothetical protein